MVEIVQILLINLGISSVALLLLLFLYGRKSSKTKKIGKPLSRDMRKIKENISEE